MALVAVAKLSATAEAAATILMRITMFPFCLFAHLKLTNAVRERRIRKPSRRAKVRSQNVDQRIAHDILFMRAHAAASALRSGRRIRR
jgi:hypothetical protein